MGELGRPAAQTKLIQGQKRVRTVRTRGGNQKLRALRLCEGNFSWGTEAIAKKTRIVDVVYNATSNELVRTKTLVKGMVVAIDGTPFRNWYYKWYGVQLASAQKTKKVVKGKKAAAAKKTSDVKVPKTRLRNWARRAQTRSLAATMEAQLASGKVLARISSRPGQVGKADGYILEGKELEFYQRKLDKKKKK